MLNDLRHAVRALRAARVHGGCRATVGLGIAVNTVAFTLLNSLALRPTPVPHAADIVRIYPVYANGWRHNLFSYPDLIVGSTPRDHGHAVLGGIPSRRAVRLDPMVALRAQ